MNDADLLRAYANERSEAALAELTRRYVSLVYSAASRQLRDPHDADDVTQAVFLLFARKAPRLAAGTVVPGWLLRATHFACRGVVRGKARRRRHEQEAAAMATSLQNKATSRHAGEPDWEQVAPLLDEAVAALNEPSRSAIALRFFEKMNYKEVADRLAIAEPAARKRVERAVEQLRGFYARRAVVLSAAGLEALVMAHSVTHAPSGMATAAAAFASGAAPSPRTASLANRLARDMVPRATKLLLAAGACLGVAVGAIAIRAAIRHSAGPQITAIVPPPAAAPRVMGRIIGGDGLPLEGVEVMLARASAPVALYGTQREGVLSVTTGADGTFDFPAEPDSTAIIARAGSGFAQVLMSDRSTGGDIGLTPWGTIVGTIKHAGKPVAGQVVDLSRADGSLEEWHRWYVIQEARTRTDAQGNFTFVHVAASKPDTPGQLKIRCEDRWRIVRVAPREILRVDIGGTGRQIVGKLAIANPNLPTFQGNLYRRFPQTMPAHQAPDTRPSGPTPARAPAILESPPHVVVNPDGTFRAEDVPPGEYQLIFGSSARAIHSSFPDDLARGETRVTVPQAPSIDGTPIDVGVVQTHPLPLLWPGQPAPDFTLAGATSVAGAGGGGGAPVRLTDFRGKYLLLYVHVVEQESSLLKPENLDVVYESFRDDPHFAMLEVAIHSLPGRMQEQHRQHISPWPVASSPEPQRDALPLGTTRRSQVIPSIYLASPTSLYIIDPQGNCAARNLNASSALSELTRLLPRNQTR